MSSWAVFAQNSVRFTASAPSTVVLDRPFQLVYTVNAFGKDLRPPEISNFEILAGPFQSQSSSMQIVNGKTTSSTSVSFTYTLQAQKTGTYNISSASITVEGQKYTSNGLSIKVLPADSPTPKSQGSRSNEGSGSPSEDIGHDNIFIRTTVSKSSVYEQEAILLSYKLYTLVDVVQCANKKMPDFNGFLKQDIEQTQNKQFAYENLNGKNYGTVVLYQVLIYPQRAGEIEIPKAVFEAGIRIQNRRRAARSIFDDFFESYTNVSKSIVAPSTKISVKALPTNKPASFSGTVGRFSLNSTISADKVKANDAVTLKLTISGAGNMKLIKTPTIKFPDGFESYDPKVNNNFKTTQNGVSGSKSVEYMFIPRHSGSYEIPASEFSYFDVQEKSYKTLRTPAYKLEVLKGEGSENTPVVNAYVSKEDVKQLGKDIRYIHTENIQLTKEEDPLFGTLICWLMYIVPLLSSLFLFFFYRKQAKENSDLSFVKNKKANKMAQRRLKLAQKLLSEGEKNKFYEEVMKAVWTYLSDKLSLPLSVLTKDTVESELVQRGVEIDVVHQFLEILNRCEFARYAPNSGQQEMGDLYSKTIQAISSLEDQIKKK